MAKKLLMLLLVLLYALPALAVDLKGQIKGTVVDPDGGPIPGVVVIVTGSALQGQAGGETDTDGRFRALNLPPGTYQVEASKPSFQTWRGTGIQVSAGATITLDITLNMSVAGEEIIVEEKKQSVDVTSTKTGATLTRDQLRDMPNAGRDYQGATSLAAGVVGGGNVNAHGGFSGSNQYYLDGVNTTDPLTNTFSMNMNFDAIEEIQVLTGGLDAEYGRSLGATVNIVTRSGGNELEVDSTFVFNSSDMQVYKPLPGEKKDENQSNDYQLATNVSGPIIRDTLWYMASLQGNFSLYQSDLPADFIRPDENDDGNADPMEPRIWKSAYLFGKLTWKPSPNHQLQLRGQSDPTWINNINQNMYGMPSTEDYWTQGGWSASLAHLWTPAKNTIVDSQVYYQTSYITVMPMLWKTDCDEWADNGVCLTDFGPQWGANDPDGFSVGPGTYRYETDRNRASINTKVTQLVDDLLGQHEFKSGLQGELLQSNSIYPGLTTPMESWTYGDADPTDLDAYTPAQMYQYETERDSKLLGYLGSWFLQDVWNPIPRLTLRPGVRLDASQLYDDLGDQVFDSVTVAPRFGAALDPTGDNRWKLHAYYGRFYDPGYLEVSSILAKTNGTFYAYNWDDRTNDWATEPFYSSYAETIQHTDLKNPYADEFDAGVSKDLGGGWMADATFIYKEGHNFWEDDEVNLIWNNEGTDVIGNRNGVDGTIYRLRTPNDVYTKYTSLEFTVSKQYDDNWGMMGSYVWSNAYGTQSDQGATAFYDIPEQRKYEVGLLGYDVPHQIKMAGSYRDPETWTLGRRSSLGYLMGWDFTMRSGYNYRRLYYNYYFQGWNSWKDDGEEPDRLPAISALSLKTGLALKVGKSEIDATVECFNVFNTRTVTSVDTTYGDEEGGIYLDSNGDVLYGTTLDRQNPRFFQLGLRGDF